MRTLLKNEQILELVESNFGIELDDCTLHKTGTHDVYRVTNTNEFYFKVYRHGSCELEDIEAEIWILNRLSELNAPVSEAIPPIGDNRVVSVYAPEGLRYGVLFTEAPGKVGDFGKEHLYQVGRSLAMVHRAADRVEETCDRFHIDLQHLIFNPFKAARRSLDSQLERRLSAVIHSVRRKVNSLERTKPYYGLCHGDVGGYNCHITEENVVTHFDFDWCGVGWRSYDLAVFLWSRHCICEEHAIADRHFHWFLDGYQRERALSDDELACLPYFAVARALWMKQFNWVSDEWQIPFIDYWIEDGRIQV